MTVEFESFAGRILRLAKLQPEQDACIFQSRGPETAQHLSWEELAGQVVARASLLLEQGLAGKPVALIFSTGNAFVIDFIACLYAGVIAVPLNLSRNAQQFSRTLEIMADAGASAVLTTEETRTFLQQLLAEETTAAQLLWLTEQDSASAELKPDAVTPEQLAFIQYTSGSTSRPKGVMVSQGSILDNQRAICKACGHQPGLIAGGWLPQFHDMGLIGHMMQPLFMGGTYVFMPPMNFIQRPRRWLELISQYRIHSSASPDFGYDHCLKFITDREDLSGLDLSCWKVALNGSEPVHAATMEAFAERFAGYGFDAAAFFPCYGMAETTLFVSGGEPGSGLRTRTLAVDAFDQGRVETAAQGNRVVSCGRISPHFEAAIVNPDSLERCESGVIGEIWLRGPSVADGYWQNPEQTSAAFDAAIAGEAEAGFLRTGDMGFIDDNELFVTGRIKEMLILRGRNLYPYDIERCCNNYSQASGGGAAVFTVERGGQTRLAALVELSKPAFLKGDHPEMKRDIRGLVMDSFDINLDHLCLVKPGTIPRTTSGKIRRLRCSELLAELESQH